MVTYAILNPIISEGVDGESGMSKIDSIYLHGKDFSVIGEKFSLPFEISNKSSAANQFGDNDIKSNIKYEDSLTFMLINELGEDKGTIFIVHGWHNGLPIPEGSSVIDTEKCLRSFIELEEYSLPYVKYALKLEDEIANEAARFDVDTKDRNAEGALIIKLIIAKLTKEHGAKIKDLVELSSPAPLAQAS